MNWLRRVLSRGRLERELERELAFHVERLEEDLAATGMPAAEARRQAMLRFGGLESVKEAARDARGTRWIESLAGDVRYAFRAMARAKAFTLAAILSLALGVGANTSVFGVIQALLLRALPVARPQQLFFLDRAGDDGTNLNFSHPGLEDLRRTVPGVALAGMSSTTRMQALLGSSAELLVGQLVTANWFEVLGVPAEAGRVLGSTDASAGAGGAAVLSDGAWRRHFAADPSVVGRTIRLNGLPVTIVGVAGRPFRGLAVGDSVDVWLPASLQHDLRFVGNARISNADPRQPWLPQDGIEWLTIVARVPGVTAAAESRIDQAYRHHREQTVASVRSPERRAYMMREHVRLIPGERGLSYLRDSMSRPLFVLMGAVALLLLVACANLASLLLARGAARSVELAVRASLGASRARLLGQLLTESVVLALIGGGLGVAVARWSSRALLRLASPGVNPIPLDLPVDGLYLSFAVGLSLATGVLFGLVPALRLSRTAPVTDLSAGRRVSGAAPSGRASLNKALVVAQVALSLTLLIGAGLFVRSFRNLLAVDVGFERDLTLSVQFDPRLAGFDEARLPGLYERLLAQTRLVPGVRRTALAESGPVSGSVRTSTISVEGRVSHPGDDEIAREDFVSPDYFSTVGMRLLGGRGFTDRDDARAPKVAIVNEAMVRQFFGGVDAIGRRIGYATTDVEIVGVLRDARLDGPREVAGPAVYYPLAQRPAAYVRQLYVRVDGSNPRAAAELRRAIVTAEPALAVREIAPLSVLNERTVSNERVVSRLTSLFGLLALAVACLGLYGTISYSVVRRTNEIGIRLALGASSGAVRWMVLRDTLVLTLVGIAAGLCMALAGLGGVGALLYGLSPRDPATIAGACSLIAVVGVFAGAAPAWRASKIDPMQALRME